VDRVATTARTTPSSRAAWIALLDSASEPYSTAGRFSYYFARGKLGGDPAYRGILERGLLADRLRILDLGCGQGLLSAWLQAAQRLYDGGVWTPGWPAPPRPQSIAGLELMESDVQRAHRALGSTCGVSQGDIRLAPFGTVDAVVILDVLHYMDGTAQHDVLKKVRAALPKGGLLLLRIGDAASGLRFRYGQWVDKWVMLLRGHAWLKTHCRSVGEWQDLLRQCGFEVRAMPMSHGTLFANVLLLAKAI
jgi:cyclopropane fatty-acyl-phospholipid synthase-like methyltransferase